MVHYIKTIISLRQNNNCLCDVIIIDNGIVTKPINTVSIIKQYNTLEITTPIGAKYLVHQ